MKSISTFFAIIICLFVVAIPAANAQNIAINATGTTADASAILDVQSSNKGMLIPQISLSSLSSATEIPNPAASLLVYNTNAALTGGKGYYYNSGTTLAPVWTRLVASGTEWKLAGNASTNPGTDFIGTTDAKGLLIKTNGSTRIEVSSDGITKIGDGTNQTKIDADGTIRLEGSATVYNDIVVPLFNSKLGSDRQPVWAKMIDNGSGSRGVYTFTFENQSSSNDEEEVFFSVQLPHNWREGTAIKPHVHWAPQSAASGKVVWGLEYSWVNYNATSQITFPNATIITATSDEITSADKDKHEIAGFSAISPSVSQDKISSILMCRFFRNSSAGTDTYNGNAAVLSFDFHYEIDAVGSKDEYIK